jgi:hypothetical protein
MLLSFFLIITQPLLNLLIKRSPPMYRLCLHCQCRNLNRLIKFFVLNGHNEFNGPAFFATAETLENIFSRRHHEGITTIWVKWTVSFQNESAFSQRQIASYYFYKVGFGLDGLDVLLLRHILLVRQIYQTGTV